MERIDRFRIVATIAVGGMGVVYRAVDETTGAPVALKTVRAPDLAHLGSIRREIHALSRIRHPGIVKIVAQGVAAGLPWYAMELLEGPTLRSLPSARRVRLVGETIGSDPASAPTQIGLATVELTDDSPRPSEPQSAPDDVTIDASLEPLSTRFEIDPSAVAKGLTFVRRLCAALAFLHGEGIVHRDLKPDNIVIRDGDRPVLVDFGLASQFTGGQGREALDVAGAVIGTVEYMAPEQIRGELVDARADLYALGCILYEIVTGKPPFEGDALLVATQHLRSRPTPPSQIADVSPEIERLILALLAKEPRRRIGYAASVAAALGRAGVDAPSDAHLPVPRAYLYRPTFAGREEAVETLTGALARAMSGRSARAFIRGESGSGKTRLAMEIARTATRRDVRVITGECVRVQGRADGDVIGAPLNPFRPVLQAIGDACRAGGADETDRIFGRRGPVLAPYEPSIALLPGQERHGEPPRLPAQAARERLLADLADAIVAFAQREPLVLVLDDLQWADELTLGAIAALAARPASAGLLTLGTYRSEEASAELEAIARAPGATHVDLGRLAPEAVNGIVSDMLAIADPPEILLRAVTANAEGNPFFVAEYLRTAVAEGLLARDDGGRWAVVAQGKDAEALYSTLPLPHEIRELVGRRLDGLSAGARGLVRAASVIGRELDAEVLATAAAMGESEELASLEELLARQVLEDVGGGRFRFVHDKLREVAYEKISADKRRALHRAVGFAIEARGGGELELGALAHHYTIGEQYDKAYEYLGKAGERALRTGAHAEAASFFGRALALASERGDVDAARRARWERLAGEAAFGLGDLAASRDRTLASLAHLGAPLPNDARGWLRLVTTQLVEQVARRTRLGGARHDEPADRLAEAASAAAQIALAYYYGGDALALVGTSLLAVNLAERAERSVQVARPYAFIGYVAGFAKLGPIARTFFERARGAGRDTGDPSGIAFALYSEAALHLGAARFRETLASATAALEILRAIGDRQEAAIVETILGHVDHFQGRFPEARARYAAILEGARARGNVQHEAWGEYAIARSLLAEGATVEAKDHIARALRLLEDHPDHASRLICDGLFASALLEEGDLAGARRHVDSIARATHNVVPTVFSTVHAYEAMADVYLAIWARAPNDADAKRAARRAVRDLRLFAGLFRLGAPPAKRARARELAILGRERAARGAIDDAVAIALELDMPFEAEKSRRARARI